MAETAPLTFTDEQLVEAIKVAPPEVQQVVAVIAMQIELQERRAEDDG
jgi:hypothetical protein